MTNPVKTNHDLSKIFLRENKYIRETVNIPATTTLAKGTVLGLDTSDAIYTATDSDSRDGSQKPNAILAEEIINSTGGAVEKANVQICIAGEVDESQLVLVDAGDDLDSIVTYDVAAAGDLELGSFRTVLQDAGIIPRAGQENTFLDN